MSALARHLARGLEVNTGHRVERIERVDGSLRVHGTVAPAGRTLGPAATDARAPEDLGAWDCVVLCLPASQAASLLQPVSPLLAAEARAVPFEPCFALGLLGGEEDEALRALALDGAFVGRETEPSTSALSWVARDSSKPGRPPGERWVLHASAAWSRASIHAPESAVTQEMIAEFARLFGLGGLRAELTYLRRWAAARAPNPLERGALFDEEARVGLGGDWACGGRIEGAFLSGLALAARVLAL